jgi:hypothetical protein
MFLALAGILVAADPTDEHEIDLSMIFFTDV